MSREADFATRMLADATLMAILVGGVYKAETVGLEGISRDETPSAFSGGYLRPCALVKQAGEIPIDGIKDYDSQIVSTSQRVEVWLYQDRQFDQIDAALARLRTLFLGHQPTLAFEVDLGVTVDRAQDFGSLDGASVARQDFIVYSVRDY